MSTLFEPFTLGRLTLPNRILMAPMTRGRCGHEGVPDSAVAKYYKDRASAGLIITEATAISARGHGWLNSPGIYTAKQKQGWRLVVDEVHNAGGHLFMQIWHMGATVHPDFVDGQLPLSASATTSLTGEVPTPDGSMKNIVTPKAMSLDEIEQVKQEFVTAAINAVESGIDGVEIHAANGFLLDQFIRDGVNQRNDEYGGTIDNRHRLLIEVIELIGNKIGFDKVAVRLSPTNNFWGIKDSEPEHNFTRLVTKLNQYNLAYLHLFEPKPEFNHPFETIGFLTPNIRNVYQGNLVVNGGYDADRGTHAVEQNEADLIAVGSPFIANPDLIKRYQKSAQLNIPNQETFYTPGEPGYNDYPTLNNL